MKRVNRVCVCGTEIHWAARSNKRTCGKQSCQRLLRNKTRRPTQTAGEAPLADDAPGTEAWCREHGISPTVWAARGVYRYGVHDEERVKESFAGFAVDVPTVRRIVRQSGGLVMPKHAAPGYAPIPPQLRPDDPVVTNPQKRWHCHPDKLTEWPVFPPEAGKLAGRKLRPSLVLAPADAAAHVSRAKSADYDPSTGFGDHRGGNRDDVHFHLGQAKYTLLGKGICKRIDVHPWGVRRIADAERVFFVLEGTLKNDAVLSAGEAVFSVPSVTVWDQDELARFAREFLPGKCVFIVPDADWSRIPQVKRQALLVRSVLRGAGVHSQIAAPPHDLWLAENHLKGIDDYLGSGRPIDGLTVLQLEAPEDRIARWGLGLTPIRKDRRERATRALRELSLHADGNGALRVPLGTLTRIIKTRKRSAVDTLTDLTGAVDITGSLETEIRRGTTRQGKAWVSSLDWVESPTITVRPEFRSVESTDQKLGDFWMNYQAVRNGVIVDRTQLDRIEATVRDMSDRLFGETAKTPHLSLVHSATDSDTGKEMVV